LAFSVLTTGAWVIGNGFYDQNWYTTKSKKPNVGILMAVIPTEACLVAPVCTVASHLHYLLLQQT